MSITNLAWTILEEARAGPLLASHCNPGTLWALRKRGLIALLPPHGGTIAITDDGVALLKRREVEIAQQLVKNAPLQITPMEEQ
jgi:hypothetical protein